MKNISSIIAIAILAAAAQTSSAQSMPGKSDKNYSISLFLEPTIGDYISVTPSKQSVAQNFMMNKPTETKTAYHHELMLGIMVGLTMRKIGNDSAYQFSMGYFSEGGQNDSASRSFSGCFLNTTFPSKIIKWGALVRVGKYNDNPHFTVSAGPWIGYEFKRSLWKYGHLDPHLQIVLSGNGLMDNFEPEFRARISFGFH